MSWRVVSLGAHAPKINALCIYPMPGGDLIEMTWKGDQNEHPELRALLAKVSEYIGSQMPDLSGRNNA